MGLPPGTPQWAGDLEDSGCLPSLRETQGATRITAHGEQCPGLSLLTSFLMTSLLCSHVTLHPLPSHVVSCLLPNCVSCSASLHCITCCLWGGRPPHPLLPGQETPRRGAGRCGRQAAAPGPWESGPRTPHACQAAPPPQESPLHTHTQPERLLPSLNWMCSQNTVSV